MTAKLPFVNLTYLHHAVNQGIAEWQNRDANGEPGFQSAFLLRTQGNFLFSFLLAYLLLDNIEKAQAGGDWTELGKPTLRVVSAGQFFVPLLVLELERKNLINRPPHHGAPEASGVVLLATDWPEKESISLPVSALSDQLARGFREMYKDAVNRVVDIFTAAEEKQTPPLPELNVPFFVTGYGDSTVAVRIGEPDIEGTFVAKVPATGGTIRCHRKSVASIDSVLGGQDAPMPFTPSPDDKAILTAFKAAMSTKTPELNIAHRTAW